MMTNRMLFLSIFLLFFVVFISCDPPDDIQPPPEEGVFDPGSGEIGEDGRPVGWGEDTHSKKAQPNYKLLFDQNDVLRLDITIDASDWQAMLDDMTEKFGGFGTPFGSGSNSSLNPLEPWNLGGDENPIYVPCNLVFMGKTWYHVGIRFKGNASLRTTWQSGSYKLPLRFNFDKFEDDFPEIKNQRFYGFDKLSLASSFFDNSLVREKVTNEIYRAAGVPVGRDAFCRVFIDYGEGRKYFGLYTLQEIPDDPMLESIFNDDKGNLYKPDGNGASFRIWDQDSFDKENNEDEADFSDVHELYDILHSDRTNESAFRARLESVFNVDSFLHYLAINQVICNWDTYGQLPHNYYLYHSPGDDLLHWIPWDFNMALDAVSLRPALSLELSSREVSQRWPLIRYLLDIPVYHAKYVFYVKKTIEEIFYPERMHTIFNDAYALINRYVKGEYGEVYQYSNLNSLTAFDNAFTELNTHVENRYQAAQQFVQKYKQELNSEESDSEATTPDVPEETAPDTPAPSTPDVPEETVPDTPAATTPDVPEETAPDTPAASTPDVPEETVPDTPAASTPDVPEETVPDTPAASTPDVPEETAPDTPAPSTPDVPEETAPDTPAATTPDVPDETAPDTPAAIMPGCSWGIIP